MYEGLLYGFTVYNLCEENMNFILVLNKNIFLQNNIMVS
jgi:hypothetical protein